MEIPYKLPMMQKAYLTLVSLAIVLTPFYLFGRDPVGEISTNPYLVIHNPKVESGVPQLADYLLIALMGLVVLDMGLSFLPRFVPIISMFFLFTFYVTTVNAVWSLQLGDFSLLKNSLFYFFNASVLTTLLILYSHLREALLKVVFHSLAASVFLQVLLAPFAQVDAWFRQPLFFTNENQLGYYALLSATVFALGARRFRANPWYQACFYMAVTYLAVISLSKAALVGMSFLYLLLIIQRPWGGLWIAVFLAIPLATIFLPDLIDKLERRMDTMDDDDSLEARGYDRIWNHPEYLFFGAGEGAYYRFKTQLQSELHSSFGTLLFSYGLVGVAIFCLGLWSVWRGAPLGTVFLLTPVFLYGMAHQGLRLRLLWVLLSFFACLMAPHAQLESDAERGAAPSDDILGPERVNAPLTMS